MIKLSNIKLDKDSDSNEIYLNLKDFIDNYSDKSTNKVFLNKIFVFENDGKL